MKFILIFNILIPAISTVKPKLQGNLYHYGGMITKMTVIFQNDRYMVPKWPLVHHQNDRYMIKMTVTKLNK